MMTIIIIKLKLWNSYGLINNEQPITNLAQVNQN